MVDGFEEYKQLFSRLIGGSTAINHLAGFAAQLTARFWDSLNLQQQQRLQQWLHDMHIESRRTVRNPLVMNENLRRAEAAMSEIDAIKKIAPPERG